MSSSSDGDYYMEIPMVYPTILQPSTDDDVPHHRSSCSDYYIVNDVDCTIRSSSSSSNNTSKVGSKEYMSSSSSSSSSVLLHQRPIHSDSVSHAYGSSSISELHMMEDTRVVVMITTSSITDRIIAITRTTRTNQSDSDNDDSTSIVVPPKVIHVDLGVECTTLVTPIVRIQTFHVVPVSSSSSSSLNNDHHDTTDIMQVVVVDAAANIITLRFHVETLQPISCTGSPSSCSSSSSAGFGPDTMITTTTSNPTYPIRCYSLSSKLNQNRNSHPYHHPLHHRITKDMITFCTMDIVIVAYTPYVLAVHLSQDIVEFWSMTTCRQTMIRQQQQQQPSLSVISSLFNKGAEYLLGSGSTASTNGTSKMDTIVNVPPDDDQNQFIPVAAICSCPDNSSANITVSPHQQHHVFTLHADGVIHHWTMALPDSSEPTELFSLLPTSVYDITSRHVPNPSLWTSDTLFNNSISMHARVYDTLVSNSYNDEEHEIFIPVPSSSSTRTMDAKPFVLLVQIQTSVPISYDAAIIPVLDDSQRPIPKESTMNLIALDGIANRSVTDLLQLSSSSSPVNSSSIRLTVPEMATDLIDMQLDRKYNGPNHDDEQPILHAMFYSTMTGTSIICSYPKTSNISILSKDPIVWSDNDPTQTLYMDSIIQKEVDRIDQLSFYSTYMESQLGNSNSSIDENSRIKDIEYEIDQRYMQYLFRPIHPRGDGTVLPPHPHHIYAAMKVVCPSTTIVPIAYNHRTDGAMTTSTSTSTPTPTSGPNIEVDVYDFIQEWRQRDRRYSNSNILVPRQQHQEITNGDVISSDLEPNVDDLLNETFLKEDERWRLFLMQVLQQEQMDRIPMSIKFFTSTGNNEGSSIGKSDKAMIVRPGYVSTLLLNGKDRDNKHDTSVLDRLCYELLCDNDFSSYISALDMHMEDTIVNNILDVSSVIGRVFECLPTNKLILRKLVDLSASDHESISQHLTALQTDNHHWYCTSLTGLGSVPLDRADLLSIDTQKQSSTNRNVIDIHTRLAASALLVRSLDTIRHLAFTRYFILRMSKIQSKITEGMLLNMYLHTTAVMCVAARMVPSNSLTKHIDMSLQQLPLHDQTMHRRSSVASILDIRGVNSETVSLDPLLMHLSRKLPYDLLPSSLCTVPMVLAQLGIRSSLAGIGQISSSSQFPELGMLVMTSEEIEYPPLALRLLTVRDASQIENDQQAKFRKILIAMCLINVSRSDTSRVMATKMVDRALCILPYDVSNPESSIDNLRILENQIGDNHTIGGAMLVDHILKAISDTEALDRNSDTDSLLARLYTALFNVSVSLENWDNAYMASSKITSWENRNDKFRRLSRAMVNAGFLSQLLSLIQTKSESPDDLYELAVSAMSEMTLHDIYTSMVIDPTVPTDYAGALYALHASLGNWKRAAQAMDMRYLNACSALRTAVTGLNTSQYSKREQIIINDLTLAALGCLYSMERISDPNLKYLLSKVNIKDDCSIFMSMNDIALRGKRSQVLKTLYDDKLGDPSFAVRAFAAESGATMISDHDIVDQLFMQGFITAGIELAVCMEKVIDGKPNGRSVLFDVISHLILDFLLPLVLDKYQTPNRPTIHQLQAAIAYMKGPTLSTTLLAHRSSKYSDLEQGPLRAGAMLLTEILTVNFTTDESPLAFEVASAMLSPHRVHTQLPAWLEELLLIGTNRCDLPGLFSRRRKPGVDGFLGNPTALLTIYIKRGMVKDACGVVTRVFNDFNYNRGHLAASRLPERGEIDIIPFDKIKLLWCLIDIRLGKVDQHTARRELESARMKMKESIDEYFRLSKITGMGQQSARFLK